MMDNIKRWIVVGCVASWLGAAVRVADACCPECAPLECEVTKGADIAAFIGVCSDGVCVAVDSIEVYKRCENPDNQTAEEWWNWLHNNYPFSATVIAHDYDHSVETWEELREPYPRCTCEPKVLITDQYGGGGLEFAWSGTVDLTRVGEYTLTCTVSQAPIDTSVPCHAVGDDPVSVEFTVVVFEAGCFASDCQCMDFVGSCWDLCNSACEECDGQGTCVQVDDCDADECYRCGDETCEYSCDDECEYCDGQGTCVDTCTGDCQSCQDGNCASDCNPACENCLNGTCVDTCTKDSCYSCQDGGCAPYCNSACETCDGAGGCEDQCDADDCQSCQEGGCDSYCDEDCEECDGSGTCVDQCDKAACLGCQNGGCVSSCDLACEVCDGSGNCVDQCNAEQCLECRDGTCKNACEPNCETCVDGECVDQCDSEQCLECRDGMCKNACQPNCESCVDGECVDTCDAAQCLACIEGACRSTCDLGCSECQSGACVDLCDGSACLACSGGSCKNKCEPGCETCNNGSCEDNCDANSCEACSGGSCKSTCDPVCETCQGGMCVSSCPAGTTCCGGVCCASCCAGACCSGNCCAGSCCDGNCCNGVCCDGTCCNGACCTGTCCNGQECCDAGQTCTVSVQGDRQACCEADEEPCNGECCGDCQECVQIEDPLNPGEFIYVCKDCSALDPPKCCDASTGECDKEPCENLQMTYELPNGFLAVPDPEIFTTTHGTVSQTTENDVRVTYKCGTLNCQCPAGEHYLELWVEQDFGISERLDYVSVPAPTADPHTETVRFSIPASVQQYSTPVYKLKLASTCGDLRRTLGSYSLIYNIDFSPRAHVPMPDGTLPGPYPVCPYTHHHEPIFPDETNDDWYGLALTFRVKAYIDPLSITVSGGDMGGTKTLGWPDGIRQVNCNPVLPNCRRVKWEGYDMSVPEDAFHGCHAALHFPNYVQQAPHEVVREGEYAYQIIGTAMDGALYQHHEVSGLKVYVEYNLTADEIDCPY